MEQTRKCYGRTDGQTEGWTDGQVSGLHPIVNSHWSLRAISSLTKRFIMYLNGIKHNMVTNLNPLTRNIGSDTRTDGQTDRQRLWGD